MTNDDNIFEIINGKQYLKDGARLRVPVTMRDSASGPMRVTDDAGRGGLNLNRPGFRKFHDDEASSHARERAYRQYEDSLVSAYKGDAVGESATEGEVCFVRNAEYPLDFGSPGHIRNVGGKLICVPDKPTEADAADNPTISNPINDPDADEDEDDNDEEERARTSRRRRAAVTGEDSARCRDELERLYEARDAELRDAWRRG